MKNVLWITVTCKPILKSVVFINHMLSNVIRTFQLIVTYFATGRQRLAAHHLVARMKNGEAVLSSVLIEKSVSMMSNVLSLNNLNKCVYVKIVFF